MADFQKINQEFGIVYSDILADFYPSVSSIGFTERNLTVNWSKAYERLHSKEGVISWFEFPISEGRYHEHLDALVWNSAIGDLYLIEAKRFSNTRSKVKSVVADIQRICEMADSIRNDARFGNAIEKIKAVYGVILADVWTENENKVSLLKSYQNKTFVEDYLIRYGLKPDIAARLSGRTFFFDEPVPVKNSDQEYYLLTMIIPLDSM